MIALLTETLLAEYEAIVAALGDNPTDDQIVLALITEADWTPEGARTILTLARTYGTAILRNALSLAEAMRIEDGEAEL